MPHRPRPGRPVPTATYRVQLQSAFTFHDAAAVVDRVAALGASHLYLSPILQAAPGSTHGYDVVDHSRVSEELGGIKGLRALAERAHAAGLGLVADVVPNHMAVPSPAYLNAQWWSLLRDGRESPVAHWFDVDWRVHGGQVLVPVLGSDLSEVLGDGEISLGRGGAAGDEPVVRYFEHEFPVRPGTEGMPLADLLDEQHYRLADWRLGGTDLNYRRFFDVTTLAAVRVEDERVFDATHEVLLGLLREGVLDGLRVDHPDGLADPRAYFTRLAEATDGAWVVAEKILEGEETLPDAWACAGTTGYDTLLRVSGVFVDAQGEAALTREWVEASSDPRSMADVVEGAKAQVVEETLGSEVSWLLRLLETLCPDVGAGDLRLAVRELLVAMDRYRAYVVPGARAPAESRGVVRAAVSRASETLSGSSALLDLVGDLVLGEVPAGSAAGERPAVHAELVVRFQQVCGPVMAKGVEDTAFYRYDRLLALNEVGGDPSRVGVPPGDLYAHAESLLASHPTGMTTLSTHDTKRSEDVRARLAVLSERADDWSAWIARGRELVGDRRPELLDGATEYLLWQTLVSTWPISGERLHGYLTKAVREAKVHTSWTAADTAYEEAVHACAELVLGDARVHEHVVSWVASSAVATRAITLGQKLLQLVLPGVPDVYQGCEVVDLSLVDPDNRRLVDHEFIRDRQERLDGGGVPTDLSDEKLLVTMTALRVRRQHPEWFTGESATFAPVSTSTEHAVAVARGDGEGQVVAIATRFASRLEARGGWDTESVSLPSGEWRELLGGATAQGESRLGDLLTDLPVALLVREDR